MSKVAVRLAQRGFALRTGGAPGADTAFEEGCREAGGRLELWLPWPDGRSRGCEVLIPSAKHFEIAATVHPVWGSLKEADKALHARNVGQVLGGDLKSPVEFVLCWTPDGCESEATRGKGTGGTATAIVVADRHRIPVFNVANVDAKGGWLTTY